MKVVILAGGLGTRLSEETTIRPKPLVEIGGKPILWHIMKIYSTYGFNDFIICTGYKGEMIKDYFSNYVTRNSDLDIDLSAGKITQLTYPKELWKVKVIDTGQDTMTGGRLAKVSKYLEEGKFMMTYGDGVSDVNIHDLLRFHYSHGRKATLTAVIPHGRYGSLEVDNNTVMKFNEKKIGGDGWINAGFFVLDKSVIDLIESDDTIFEGAPLRKLSENGELMAYKHNGFWRPMDTLNDKIVLEKLWSYGKPPWKVWSE